MTELLKNYTILLAHFTVQFTIPIGKWIPSRLQILDIKDFSVSALFWLIGYPIRPPPLTLPLFKSICQNETSIFLSVGFPAGGSLSILSYPIVILSLWPSKKKLHCITYSPVNECSKWRCTWHCKGQNSSYLYNNYRLYAYV